ncbi:MAG: hypothetical protein ACOCRK_11610 [bacterium]
MTSPTRAKKRREYREKVKEYTEVLKKLYPNMSRQKRRSLAWENIDFRDINNKGEQQNE